MSQWYTLQGKRYERYTSNFGELSTSDELDYQSKEQFAQLHAIEREQFNVNFVRQNVEERCTQPSVPASVVESKEVLDSPSNGDENIIDNGLPWYINHPDPRGVTWTVTCNNRALIQVARYYLCPTTFHPNFTTLDRSLWYVSSNKVEGEPGDDFFFPDIDLDVPIESFQDGSHRRVCGAPFRHMLRRQWTAKIKMSFVGHKNNTSSILMREMYGTFGWYFLAGRLNMGDGDYLVLFCNESWLKGGHNLYISDAPFWQTAYLPESKLQRDHHVVVSPP